MLDRHEREAKRCLDAGLVIPAYEAALVCSHQFNVLDARGAVSATDRVGIIRRIRELACACARAYVSGQEGQRAPLPEPEPAAV
jgi:glycyl-tRNA synthetase alpha chain